MKNKFKNDPIVIIDEQHTLPKKAGNGILRYFLTVDNNRKLLRYSLAYINYQLYSLDNGRVIGYDNDHNYHHRHCMGVIEPVKFSSYEQVLDQFEKEWRDYHERLK